MKSFGIRERILLAALAPATLVAVLVSGMLVAEHTQQAHIDQHHRLSAVARQLAAAAEYNLFVGNNEALVRLLDAAVREPDVIGAAFLDPTGLVLASSLPVQDLPSPLEVMPNFDPPTFSEHNYHWHGLPIRAANYGEFDLFAGTKDPPAPLLGQLLLKVSNDSLNEGMRRYALKAASSALLMLVFGVLLALALSRGLIRTLGDIGRVVDGIRHGRHDLRVEDARQDELGELARGINTMAESVEETQEALAARVAEATATLRRERDEAAEAAQARSRFFAAASHDLRQPLQALGLFVARLGRDAHHTPLRPQVDQVVQSVRNLRGLLDTLLDYSRLSGQVYRIDEKPVRAVDLFARIIEEFSAAAADKRLVLRHRVADCWLLTDRALLHRILINLVGNAIRHTRHGSVLLACRRGATHARIEIWDTGPGIPPEQHAAIFEELVQLDNPERDAEKGLGLGLAIVRRTADLLRHPVGLCSRVGHGSRFSLLVPIAPPPAATADDNPPDLADDPLEQARVVVIGEQEEIAGMIDGWGCDLVVAANADEARAWIVGHGAPDALVWDCAGGAAGTEQAHALLDWLETTTGYRLPAVMVSSGPVPSPDERPDGTTPRLPLARPFRPARLRALLARVLETGNGNDSAATLS
jgi:signal transduction histidine kinase